MSGLVVKTHRPWQFALAVIALSTFLATLTWVLLDRGHWSLILDRVKDNQDWKQLWEVNQSMEDERQGLLERVLMLERITDVDKQTAAMLQDEIKTLQETIYVLKGELEFYQGVMDATRDARGLNINGIYIEPLVQADTYRLKLVLTHVAKGAAVAEGQIDVTLEGIRDDKKQKIKLEEVRSDDTAALSYKVRSFSRFEFKLSLPDGFIAQQVVVELKPKGKNKVMIKEVFDWVLPAS